MVGYQPNDSMSSADKLIAGCLSGVVTRTITQPMDVLKLRQQLTKRKPTNIWFKATRQILREEGVTAFFHGHSLGQLHAILAVSSQFHVYELGTKFVAKNMTNKETMPYANFICGILAGIVSATLVSPLEVIRVRQMVISNQYKGLINSAMQVYKHGGILAFYEGLPASLLQMGPSVGISFFVFSTVQPFILSHIHDCNANCHHARGNHHDAQNMAFASAVAGSAAGFVSKSLTYPFDLVKRRLQLASHKKDVDASFKKIRLIKCKNLSDCFVKTIQKDGFMGLFRGWRLTIYKAQVTSIVAFTSYEMFCYFVREYEYA